MTATDAREFFYQHAGWSHGPNETCEQGRRRCARGLAQAETWLAQQVHTVEWEEDVEPDRSYLDDGDERPLFCCCVSVKRGSQWVRESLCGIDLGPTGNECDPYMRVVVAELAFALMEE